MLLWEFQDAGEEIPQNRSLESCGHGRERKLEGSGGYLPEMSGQYFLTCAVMPEQL